MLASYVGDSVESNKTFTRGKKQRFDKVRMKKAHKVIKGAEEPGTGVMVGPYQLIHLLETHFIRSYLRVRRTERN